MRAAIGDRLYNLLDTAKGRDFVRAVFRRKRIYRTPRRPDLPEAWSPRFYEEPHNAQD